MRKRWYAAFIQVVWTSNRKTGWNYRGSAPTLCVALKEKLREESPPETPEKVIHGVEFIRREREKERIGENNINKDKERERDRIADSELFAYLFYQREMKGRRHTDSRCLLGCFIGFAYYSQRKLRFQCPLVSACRVVRYLLGFTPERFAEKLKLLPFPRLFPRRSLPLPLESCLLDIVLSRVTFSTLL